MTELLDHLREGLAGRYTVLDEIGRGGMAIVFRAEEHHPPRQVAIKVLDPAVATHIARDHFIREIQYCANVPHPQCVPIFAAGETAGLLYYVMPYIAGESLRQRLAPRHQARQHPAVGRPRGRGGLRRRGCAPVRPVATRMPPAGHRLEPTPT